MGLHLKLKIGYIVILAQQTFSTINQSKLEIISYRHGLRESNPHNKNKTHIIKMLKLFPKSNSPKDIQV